MSDQLVQHQLQEALKQAARSAAVADKGVVLDVTWAEPYVAEALAIVMAKLALWSNQSLVSQVEVVDMLLDLKALLLPLEVTAP
jgi:hypothetical protein